jgi:hypothetical protein
MVQVKTLPLAPIRQLMGGVIFVIASCERETEKTMPRHPDSQPEAFVW